MRSVGCCSVSLTLLGFHGRACQVPLSMEFSRQEYWSGLPFPSLGDLPDPGSLPHWQVDSSSLIHQGNPDCWYTFRNNVTLALPGLTIENYELTFKSLAPSVLNWNCRQNWTMDSCPLGQSRLKCTSKCLNQLFPFVECQQCTNTPVKFVSSSLFFFFWTVPLEACGILVPQPGVEPWSSALRAQSPNHWTTRGILFVSIPVWLRIFFVQLIFFRRGNSVCAK